MPFVQKLEIKKIIKNKINEKFHAGKSSKLKRFLPYQQINVIKKITKIFEMEKKKQ